ncbi:MAG TPA: hypothetical protein DDX39_05615 [Bacteroidales bacterium]|nr:MAG: hypothetical protein A2W98_06885 [Bacteroidetes bacterium GWF2_33_38]OFY76167.1 MAG: hypothetical protein A2265_09555 [Bacteroidetes bacterium RIFOXYA12_FULL_33_9]HBF88101.1 hypothetical protein [Bacteroidales bacterium]
MKSFSLIFSIILLCATIVKSQTTEAEKVLKSNNLDTLLGWKKGGLITIAFTQVSLSKWAAGGENSIAGNGFVNLFANLKQRKFAWDNNLDLGYGIIRQGDSEAPWIKSDDKIDFTSKYGQKANEHLFYAGLLNFKSQFNAGYAKPGDSIAISNFLSPGYILLAIGMDYKPNDNVSIFVSPITDKTTIVLDELLSNAGAFGVEEGKKMRTELGGYMKLLYKKDIKENITFGSRLELFANYLKFKTVKDVDVLWENVIAIKISKYISANITTTLIWDNDVDIAWTDVNDNAHFGPTTQFKEVLGIGFSYKF